MPTLHSSLTGDSLHVCRPMQGSGTPVSSLTPNFAGTLAEDTDGPELYRSTGATSADWTKIDLGSSEVQRLAPMASGSRGGGTLEGRIVYPGLGVPLMHVGSVSNGTGAEDDDLGVSRVASYIDTSDGDDSITPFLSATWYSRIPTSFTGWHTTAIAMYGRLVSYAGGSTLTATLEVYDPATGVSFGTAVDDSRVLVAGEDFTALAITGAQLAGQFAADDPLKVSLVISVSPLGGGSHPHWRSGPCFVNWGDL